MSRLDFPFYLFYVCLKDASFKPFLFNSMHYVGAFLIAARRIKLSLLLEHLGKNATQSRMHMSFDVVGSPATSKEIPMR